MDKYRIDSHKLIYHVHRVSDWLRGEQVYPIYLEISPAGGCNHRCTFCAKDFMGYQKRYLDSDVLQHRLREMGSLGVKSVMYAGEGEPLLHQDIGDIVKETRASGIDVALTTNGVLLTEPLCDQILANTEWIKVSINAGTPASYSKIHRCKPTDFDRVVDNMAAAATMRVQRGYQCVLGLQMLLLPENWDEAETLARIARDIGMDYLVVKPYSHHPDSKTQQYADISYEGHAELEKQLRAHDTGNFRVVFRAETMEQWDQGERHYDTCLALPFWAYLDSGGTLWGCSTYLEDKRFRYGNIYEESFASIWNGQPRLDALGLANEGFHLGHCRYNCRMDKINKYLWELKRPPTHVNFI
jgi:MoaA/NifB/PqqE/SkfB family radical SAM enzyme